MSHEQFQSLLSAYLDGELTDEQRLALDSHQQMCEDCRVLLVTTQKSIELSRMQTMPRLPKAFREQLTQQVQRAYKLGKRCEG